MKLSWMRVLIYVEDHVRAFFWERMSAFEPLLHWVNQTQGMGLEEKDVRWLTVTSQARKLRKWSETLQSLEDEYRSDWHFLKCVSTVVSVTRSYPPPERYLDREGKTSRSKLCLAAARPDSRPSF